MGDVLKKIRAVLFYLWQFTFALLQNIIGLIMLAIYKPKGAQSEWYHNALITYIDKKNFGGVSLAADVSSIRDCSSSIFLASLYVKITFPA